MSKMGVDVTHESADGPVPVIAGDVGVQNLPLALDLVVIGAVGRQELKLDPGHGAQCRQCLEPAHRW